MSLCQNVDGRFQFTGEVPVTEFLKTVLNEITEVIVEFCFVIARTESWSIRTGSVRCGTDNVRFSRTNRSLRIGSIISWRCLVKSFRLFVRWTLFGTIRFNTNPFRWRTIIIWQIWRSFRRKRFFWWMFLGRG